MIRRNILTLAGSILVLSACTKPEEAPKPVEKPAATYHIYVTNEGSNNVSVIDPTTNEVTATVNVGKRPRGVHGSPDGKTLYIALSGSVASPPGSDESKKPPADRNADGIGSMDIAQNKMVKIMSGGQDPEE